MAAAAEAVFPGLVALVGFYGLLVEPAQVEQHVSASRRRPSCCSDSCMTSLTLGGVIAIVIAIALVVGAPAFLKLIGLGGIFETVLSFVRWPVLALLAILGFALLALGDVGRGDRGRAVDHRLGAVLGLRDALLILLMWFFLSSYAVLIGAEINSETRAPDAQGHDERSR